MKSLTLILAAFLGLNSAMSIQDLNIHATELKMLWSTWKSINSKVYAESEESKRFTVFAENYIKVVTHNHEDKDTKLALNQFADLTDEEFAAEYANGLILDEYATLKDKIEPETSDIDYEILGLPQSVDWRVKGAVTPVKNQGTCGSCWAFSATGALEGLYYINNTQLVSFSEQNFVDCVTKDAGCDGGWPIDAFSYAAQNGVESEADYPYEGKTKKCAFDSSKAYHVNSGFYNVTPKSLDQIKAAIVSQPVSVGVQANQIAFQFYAGGVIKTLCGDKIDHGVLVVGYEVVKGNEAFIVKNSWGQTWGNDGYLYISTNEAANDGYGVCGILTMPAIPYKN